MTTSAPESTNENLHADATPPMSAPTYRACACGWTSATLTDVSAVDGLQQHLAAHADQT